MDDPITFLQDEALHGLKHAERAIALLWWHGRVDHNAVKRAGELCAEIERAGYSRPNSTTLAGALRADSRVANSGKHGFRIKIDRRAQLDEVYGGLITGAPPKASNAVLDLTVLRNARPYNLKVAQQINASYDARLFDCCAVMCRRLVESLIIDAYEVADLDDEIKGRDGNFVMLKGMVNAISKNNTLNIGRSAVAALKDMKALGDLSAHSRRYNAVASDIASRRDDLRVLVQDLAHMSGQA